MSFTQDELDELVRCRKVIIQPPRQNMRDEGRHRRNDMRVADDQGREFDVFMRQCIDFEENFSIGLVFSPHDGDRISLLRCNGPHGEHVNISASSKPHFGHHIHRATVNAIDAGFAPECQAEPTTEYADFRGALRCFLSLTGIEWGASQFPILREHQLDMFEQEEDGDQ